MELNKLVLKELRTGFNHPSLSSINDFILVPDLSTGGTHSILSGIHRPRADDEEYLEMLCLTDTFHGLVFLRSDGTRVREIEFKPRTYSQLSSFVNLKITSDGRGDNGYRPLLTGIERPFYGLVSSLCVIDGKKLNIDKLNTSRQENDKIPMLTVLPVFSMQENSSISTTSGRFGPMQQNTPTLITTLDDVLLIRGDEIIKRIARDTDSILYGITANGDIVYCADLKQNAPTTSVANIASWEKDITGMTGRQKFVFLRGVNYWRHYDILLYAFGYSAGDRYATLRLVSGSSKPDDRGSAIRRSPYPIVDTFNLDFLGEVKEGTEGPLIDEIVQAEDNSLFVSAIPYEEREYNYKARDIYYVLIDHSTQRLFAVAKCRITNIDRADNDQQRDIVLHPSYENGGKRVLYALLDKSRIKKMEWDIT